jgi:hypothetical protein
MPLAPDQATIRAASAYWFEQLPYTNSIGTLAASTTASVFSLSGWNAPQVQSTWVELTSLGTSQQGNVQYHLTYDPGSAPGSPNDTYALGYPPGLRQAPIGRGAVTSLSLSAINNSTTIALPNVQTNYTLTVWRMPVAFKVLYGLPLTPAEQSIASAVNLDTDPNNQTGVFPIPWDATIDRTYSNRQIDGVLTVPALPTATTSASQFYYEAVRNSNEMLVLRRVRVESNLDDGVLITVDRDNDQAHVVLRGEQCGEDGVPMFVPATNNLTFTISAASPPAAPVPVGLEIWRLSLSNILRLRMNLITTALLAAQYQLEGMTASRANELATSLANKVLAGVS